MENVADIEVYSVRTVIVLDMMLWFCLLTQANK